MSGLFSKPEAAPAPRAIPMPDPEGAKAASRRKGARRTGARQGSIMSALTGETKLGG